MDNGQVDLGPPPLGLATKCHGLPVAVREDEDRLPDVPAIRHVRNLLIALALWTALPSYRGEASERTWLYRVAHNTAIRFTARRVRRSRHEHADDSYWYFLPLSLPSLRIAALNWTSRPADTLLSWLSSQRSSPSVFC